MTPLKRDTLDLINRLQAENEELKDTVKVLRFGVEQAHLIRKDGKSPFNLLKAEIKAEAYKEFAEKVDKILERYSHLHKYADEARSSKEEYADGTPMEMVSVWEVLSLKKWEMCDYETMNTLQHNIENIEKARLLSELEKDFMLLKREMVGEDNAES